MEVNSDYPLITVVTLTYNKFDKLYDTISSVLRQDYPAIEYIISDDGSRGFPEEAINAFINDHASNNVSVQIIANKENHGTVRNINTAYKNGHGEYYINLSCGDVFYDDHVVAAIYERFIQTNANVLCTTRLAYDNDFVSQYYLPHVSEREIIERLDTPEKQYKAFITTEYYDMASGSAMSFTKRIMEEMDYFDENFVLWEDGPFLARYLQAHKLEFAYDIVSVWYELDGISTVDVKHRNPMLQADSDRFAKTLRVEHLELFSKKERKQIKFNTAWGKCVDKKDKLKAAIPYIPQYLHHRKIALGRRKAKLEDQVILAEK